MKTIETIKQMIADGQISQEVAEKYFPELRDKNERIRKELIEYVKDQQSSFISAPDCRDKYEEEENNKYNSWIAWLEEQGKPTYNKELSELLHKVICRFINDPDIPYSDREKVSMKVLPYVELLEKKGKQGPVNKIEPKFIVDNG